MRRVLLLVLLLAFTGVACATTVPLDWPGAVGDDDDDDDDDDAVSPLPAVVITGTVTISTCWQLAAVVTTPEPAVLLVVHPEGDEPAPASQLLLLQVTEGASPPTPSPSPSSATAGKWQRVVTTGPATTETFGSTAVLRVPVDAASFDVPFSTNLVPALNTVGRFAQACSVPVFANLRVAPGGQIEADSWTTADGRGGVVAFDVTGTLVVEGNITASYAGFEGGVQELGGSSCGDMNPFVAGPDVGGRKGEGWIGPLPSGYRFGWGAYGSAGGGGHCDHNGGGGGANGADGGVGGRAFQDSSLMPGPGGFGLAPPWADDRLVFGGGGGAGHGNDAGSGGRGGGIVLIRFGNVVLGTAGVHGVIGASGENGYDAGGSGGTGGAGGGGAGGTVRLDWHPDALTSSHAFPNSDIEVHAYGGEGMAPTGANTTCGGAGGGGAGGRLRVPTGAITNHYGGGHGSCGGDDTGAGAGDTGIVVPFSP